MEILIWCGAGVSFWRSRRADLVHRAGLERTACQAGRGGDAQRPAKGPPGEYRRALPFGARTDDGGDRHHAALSVRCIPMRTYGAKGQSHGSRVRRHVCRDRSPCCSERPRRARPPRLARMWSGRAWPDSLPPHRLRPAGRRAGRWRGALACGCQAHRAGPVQLAQPATGDDMLLARLKPHLQRRVRPGSAATRPAPDPHSCATAW